MHNFPQVASVILNAEQIIIRFTDKTVAFLQKHEVHAVAIDVALIEETQSFERPRTASLSTSVEGM